MPERTQDRQAEKRDVEDGESGYGGRVDKWANAIKVKDMFLGDAEFNERQPKLKEKRR